LSDPTELQKTVDQIDTAIETLTTQLFYAVRSAGQELQPMIHMVGTDEAGEPVSKVFQLANTTPSEAHDIMQEEAKAIGAVWVATIAEAWQATVEGSPDNFVGRVADHPDKVETLVLAVEGPMGSRMVTWEIKDNKLINKNASYSDISGGAVGLLPKPDTTKLN
jgi:hypothetical protein